MSSLRTSPRWSVAASNEQKEQALVQDLSLPSLVSRILVARGIDTPDKAQVFLSPSLDRDWLDPSCIPGLVEVANRVERALVHNEAITVFGDFDVDGISSTCLLTEALRDLGGNVQPFIPRRFDEGYGLTHAALERMIDTCRPSLVVTVDNGIAAREEVALLLDQGIDIVVTDHHEPADLVPVGIPVADPKLSADCPSRDLAGAGVALKLVQLLGERLGQPQLWRRYTEVAALGTVSDMMKLTSENRALVADGIAHMRKTSRPGYLAIAALAHCELSEVTADGLSFSLIPRLNSAGRMADPRLALDALLATDPIEAARLASELEKVNQQRRDIEGQLAQEAQQRVEDTYDGGRVIVVGGEGWHEGVKGIVASRMTNRYHVPALLFSIHDGTARGSGRSVGSVNLFEAISQCSDILTRFGGHAGAVGVTLPADHLDELRERLSAILSEVPAERFIDTEEVSAVVGLDELDIDTVSQISALEPFGQANKVPLLAVEGVTMCDRAIVGKTGEHLRFVATDGRFSVPAIMFRVEDIEQRVTCDSVVDLVFEAVAERWAGRVKTKLMVKDILVRDCSTGNESLAPTHEAFHVDSSSQQVSTEPSADASRRGILERLPYEELTRTLIHAFIGSCAPHSTQQDALEELGQGHSVLTVMGTGRGKSLIFQVHAAREALVRKRASVFVYPLRALVADQSFHLTECLASLGLSCCVLTGETPHSQREVLFKKLAAGGLDVVLTTPEFLAIHAKRFAATGRIGFVAIDEAHHAGLAKGGERSAYLELPEVLASLGDPCVLAATATADTACAQELCQLLHIQHTLIDCAVRENLKVVDERNLASRENRLVYIVASGEKVVIYVNSRDAAVSLARTLRRRVPEHAHQICFYHAGLSRSDRSRVEQAFRCGDLTCIVSTSAFGEGVNLPDIRHVVLYHMPFGAIEFNQMSGRAGRDGNPASIHLLFSERDARINERLLDTAAPQRPELVVLYRALQTMWRSHRGRTGQGGFQASSAEIAQMCAAVDARVSVEDRVVISGLGVFEELGLARVQERAGLLYIEMVERPGKVELTESIRYLEGLRSRMEFTSFRSWALSASASDMLARINRPIAPRVG